MGAISFLILAIIVFFPLILGWRSLRLKRQNLLHTFRLDTEIGLSLEREDYKIAGNGYRRSNRLERKFRRRYFFDLLEVFDHSCANCNQAKTKLEIDHFFIPKSFGGNLIMEHKKGYLVCNGILLCRRCNGNKADKSVEDFFSPELLKDILYKNTVMSYIVNDLDPREFLESHTL